MTPHDMVRELQATCLLPRVSSAAALWSLSAMLKVGLREPGAVRGVDVEALRAKMGSEDMEGVQVCVCVCVCVCGVCVCGVCVKEQVVRSVNVAPLGENVWVCGVCICTHTRHSCVRLWCLCVCVCVNVVHLLLVT